MKLCIILAIAFAFGLGKVISSSSENEPNAEELEQRRDVLRNMTKKIWLVYVNELNRTNDTSSSSVKVWSEPKNRVILNIMTTLWTMGLKEEFSQGREWISNNFGNLSQVETPIHVGQYMNQFVGGLLSCYALTNDTMFRDKAFEIASLLQSGYDNQTGIANYAIPPKAHKLKKLPKFVGLSEIGGSMLEARYLSSLAPGQFADRTSLWRAFLRNQTADSSNNRVLLSGFDTDTGNFSGDQSLTSFQTWPFYASLVKAYPQSNGTDLEAAEMYVKAIETAVQLDIITVVNGTGLSYIRDYKSGKKQFDKFMYYKGCNYGALLRIGADALETIREHNQTIASKTDQQLNETITQFRMLAEQITETCHFAANQTAAKLLLPLLYINEQDKVTIDPKDLSWLNYKFDSGLEESYFVLWRSTKEPKYRDYAWELTQAYKSKFSLYKKNLNLELYSAGFKYLYLIFSEDSALPLDQWIFSPLGHPLPICGRNGTMPKC